MKINRRPFIISLVGITISIPLFKHLFSTKITNFHPEPTFSALIDTFIPADEYPGAIDQGIDVELMGRIRSDKDYLESTVQNLIEIDKLSNKFYNVKFEDASLEQRTNLISSLLVDDSRQELKLQLKTFRNQIITQFYTSQSAFDMLDYHPASQGGYPDYDDSI